MTGKLAAVETFLQQIVRDVEESGFYKPNFEGLQDDLRITANPETLACSDCGKEFTSYLYDLCPACIAKADADKDKSHIHRT